MQSSSTVSGVPFRKNLRRGQRRALECEEILSGQKLNIKLPTGYGKTFTACCVYSIRKHHQKASRLFYIVPTVEQLNQFIAAAPQDLYDAGVDGPRNVTDVSLIPDYECVNRHRRNTCQVFVATIQYLLYNPKILIELLAQGNWMIVIDEYHHYGEEKAWGKLIGNLSFDFLLAMSATPYRPSEDSAFGEPHVSITYREGVDEGVLKPLKGHAYEYRLDTIDENGNVKSYTTTELVKEVGDDSPEKIERFRLERKMRWSPKYVSPLVSIPITRMLTERQRTGQHHLQALISAMCVSHAELVCMQVRSMFPHLNIDWVGTGKDGRPAEENTAIIKKFCPPKPSNSLNRRPDPELDILVHVGIAGEGLDVSHISEIIFLKPAAFNNSTYQIVGRASRFLPDRGHEDIPIQANICFDGSTELSLGRIINKIKIRAVGDAIMDAMDLLPLTSKPGDPDPDPDPNPDFPPELPEEPIIYIADLKLISIDSGDEGVQKMAALMQGLSDPNSDYIKFEKLFADPNHQDWDKVIEAYKKMLEREAQQYDEKSILAQWNDSVISAVSTCIGLVAALATRDGMRVEKGFYGDVGHRINKQKMISCGPISHNIEVYRTHYAWIVTLERELRMTRRIPSWLK
jgi:superfamily II DNA or RNA helicase